MFKDHRTKSLFNKCIKTIGAKWLYWIFYNFNLCPFATFYKKKKALITGRQNQSTTPSQHTRVWEEVLRTDLLLAWSQITFCWSSAPTLTVLSALSLQVFFFLSGFLFVCLNSPSLLALQNGTNYKGYPFLPLPTHRSHCPCFQSQTRKLIGFNPHTTAWLLRNMLITDFCL